MDDQSVIGATRVAGNVDDVAAAQRGYPAIAVHFADAGAVLYVSPSINPSNATHT